MLAKCMTESEENIRRLSIVDKSKLYIQIRNWFNSEAHLDEISTKSLNDFLWSHDPITTEGGVIDFCREHKLIEHIDCISSM